MRSHSGHSCTVKLLLLLTSLWANNPKVVGPRRPPRAKCGQSGLRRASESCSVHSLPVRNGGDFLSLSNCFKIPQGCGCATEGVTAGLGNGWPGTSNSGSGYSLNDECIRFTKLADDLFRCVSLSGYMLCSIQVNLNSNLRLGLTFRGNVSLRGHRNEG